MKINIKKLPKNKIELTVKLEPEEYQKEMEKAAQKISQKSKINGFRPGKAPYKIVEQKFGAGAIMEEAINDIIQNSYIKALGEKKLIPIEAPKIDVIKMAPNNPLEYKATVSLMPKVKIGNIDKIKIKAKKIKIDEKKVDQTIKQLAESRAKEKITDRGAKKNDILEIDLDLLKDNLPVEGGQSRGYKVIMGEPHYIPGFEEKLKGMKKGEKKEFDIKFPKDHYNKTLAGQIIKCKVDVKGVYERDVPKISDDFAKTLGNFKNLKELQKQIKDNLEIEAKQKEKERQELEMLDEVIKVSEFEEIPEILLKEEVHKMIHELTGNLANQGIKLEDYLTHLKKTEEELKKDFLPQAEKRVKTALFIQAYARENNINITEKEVDDEIKKLLLQYNHDENAKEQIKSPEYKNYLTNVLSNQKVIQELKKKIIQTKK